MTTKLFQRLAFVWFLRFVSAVLIFAPLVLLGWNFVNTTPILQPKGTKRATLPVGISPVDSFRVSTQSKPPTGPHATLTLELDQLLVAERKVQANARLTFSDALRQSLWDDKNRQFVADHGQLKSDFSDVNIEFWFADTYASEFEPTVVSIPLSKLFSTHNEAIGSEPAGTFRLNLPVFGQPSLYPGDWYFHSSLVSLSLPTPLAVRIEHPGSIGFAFAVPLDIEVRAGVALADWSPEIIMEPDKASERSRTLSIGFVRHWPIRAYVYTMALVPVLICVLFLHQFFVQARRPAMFAEALATMIAVLPLRAVLVPPDMPGLTRTDFILGFGLAAIAALVLLRYAADLINNSAKDGTHINAKL